jgi:hypothetical protein
VAFSPFGEVQVTDDAGASWRKIAREFGEIRAAAWVPNQFRIVSGTGDAACGQQHRMMWRVRSVMRGDLSSYR